MVKKKKKQNKAKKKKKAHLFFILDFLGFSLCCPSFPEDSFVEKQLALYKCK